MKKQESFIRYEKYKKSKMIEGEVCRDRLPYVSGDTAVVSNFVGNQFDNLQIQSGIVYKYRNRKRWRR